MKEVVCQVENSRSIGNSSTTGSNTESIMMTKRIKNASSALFARRLSQWFFESEEGSAWIAFRRMRGQSCT